MRIFSRSTLREFWERHPDAEVALRGWYQETRLANWGSPLAVRNSYPDSSILGNDRVVFRIKGNSYRLVVEVNYPYGRVYIRFVGTHSEYDRINALEV